MLRGVPVKIQVKISGKLQRFRTVKRSQVATGVESCL